MMKMFLNELGYECDSILEAEAIIYSELLDEGLTGIAFSFGAGMVNICMMNLGEHLTSFSIPKSGDWIDHSIAVALNMTDSLAQSEKEAGINLNNPQSKVEQAAVLYYQNLLEYVIEVLAYKLEEVDLPSVSDGYPIVLAGGGSIAEGFDDMFKKILNTADLPFKVSGVKPAKNKMNVVANGCLMAAMM
jgi:Tfp pilus assembly PilM family ATPase